MAAFLDWPGSPCDNVTQPGASLHFTSDKAVTNGSPLEWDSACYDNGGYVNLGTSPSRLTVPNTSLVRVTAVVNSASATRIEIQKNGADFDGMDSRFGYTSLTGDMTLQTGILSAAASDYFEVNSISGSTETYQENASNLAIEKVDSSTKYALVKHSTTQSLSSGTTALAFDTDLADTDAWHDTTTNNSRLTVPSGVSLIRVTGAWYSATTTNTQCMAIIFKNGSENWVGAGHMDVEYSGEKALFAGSAVVEVSASDYFELRVNTNTSLTMGAGNQTWFCIEEIPSDTKRCLVNRITSNQTLSDNEPVQWNSEVYDTDGIFDSGTDNTALIAPSGVTQARLSFGLAATGLSANAIAIVTRNDETNRGDVQDRGLPGCDTDTFSADFLNAVGAWVPCTPGDKFKLRLSGVPTALANEKTWFCAEFR